jgi:hypothetical protein
MRTRRPTGRYQRSKMIGLTIITVLLTEAIACSLSIKPSVNVGSIEVSQLSVSYDIDFENGGPINPATVFPSTTERIYVSYYLEASQKVHLTTVWYQEDQVVLTQGGEHKVGWIFSWAEPGAQGQFMPGNYRVEIRYGTAVLAETEFIVEKDPTGG